MEEIDNVEVKPQLVVSMRRYDKYEMIGMMIPEICNYAVEKGTRILGQPGFICHELTPEESVKADQEGNADVEVVVPVADRVEDCDDIRCYELPGGRMAKVVHKGPYQECGPTYAMLFDWIEKKGKRISGPTREVYLNDPNVVTQEDILTEIYAPVD